MKISDIETFIGSASEGYVSVEEAIEGAKTLTLTASECRTLVGLLQKQLKICRHNLKDEGMRYAKRQIQQKQVRRYKAMIEKLTYE